jgi:hypothetical protein
MKTKLTLSLPQKTIRTAKQIAKTRGTTVSALFAESVDQWRNLAVNPQEAHFHKSPDLNALLGAFQSKPPFDKKSGHIREKHG